jgi:hypothetical protein
MENKEPISGAIQEDVSVRSGRHNYEPLKDVIELSFHGYNCNYIQVVDLVTARSLMNQLKDLLPPNYQEL